MIKDYFVYLTVSLLAILVLIMWGKINKFDEKVAWTEQQLLDIKEDQKYAPFMEKLAETWINSLGGDIDGKRK